MQLLFELFRCLAALWWPALSSKLLSRMYCPVFPRYKRVALLYLRIEAILIWRMPPKGKMLAYILFVLIDAFKIQHRLSTRYEKVCATVECCCRIIFNEVCTLSFNKGIKIQYKFKIYYIFINTYTTSDKFGVTLHCFCILWSKTSNFSIAFILTKMTITWIII